MAEGGAASHLLRNGWTSALSLGGYRRRRLDTRRAFPVPVDKRFQILDGEECPPADFSDGGAAPLVNQIAQRRAA